MGASHQALDRFRGTSQGPSAGVSPRQRFIFLVESGEEAEKISQREAQRRLRRGPEVYGARGQGAGKNCGSG